MNKFPVGEKVLVEECEFNFTKKYRETYKVTFNPKKCKRIPKELSISGWVYTVIKQKNIKTLIVRQNDVSTAE